MQRGLQNCGTRNIFETCGMRNTGDGMRNMQCGIPLSSARKANVFDPAQLDSTHTGFGSTSMSNVEKYSKIVGENNKEGEKIKKIL